MANVATGMPLGIWTMECSESTPAGGGWPPARPERHGRLWRQHARQVGRAAGTGDDGLEARVAAAFGVGEHFVGHAVGRDHPCLEGDIELGGISAASFIVSQSLLEPITMPTKASGFEFTGFDKGASRRLNWSLNCAGSRPSICP